MFFDPTYLIYVLVPTLLLSLAAQAFVKSAYSKWSNERNSAGLTGAQVAERIFARTDVQSLPLEGVQGQLSDHYDPGAGVVRLSQGIATVPRWRRWRWSRTNWGTSSSISRTRC